ncbi:MmgE/PrpD family protein [Halomonas salipaludis]|uniref:MmgE/PrpD family protein n=1 Tax=Halomonas salipaludis TaxID=2032625 RepID=UPI0015956676|nr:MmgE/PrpD family protein [Halomonas salipaludis]
MNAVAKSSTSSPSAAQILADYATSLRYEDLPPHVIELARQCLVDAVACAVFGKDFPWSQTVLEYARSTGEGGPCRLPGVPELRLGLPQAALALGTFGHAFELDSLRKPGAGVHPGATVALPALAAAQANGASGRDLLVAIVAGCEVMFRIGAATLHTPEKVGFHAPGLTGPFGAATACGVLSGLSASQLTHAYGIAGSLASGLLAFARVGRGGMVKRLHLGRAAESGVLATNLAAAGYEGPDSVLDGEFGLLDTFCGESSPDLLTAGLRQQYEIERLCIKRYACHVTAQAPVQFLREQMATHGLTGHNIEAIVVRSSRKVVTHHSELEPNDIMLAQYSVPFTLAIAAFLDPIDPCVFDEKALHSPDIRALAKRIQVTEREGPVPKGWGAEVEVHTYDGRIFTGTQEAFLGSPEEPLSQAALRAKFDALCAGLSASDSMDLFDSLWHIEATQDLSQLVNSLDLART